MLFPDIRIPPMRVFEATLEAEVCVWVEAAQGGVDQLERTKLDDAVVEGARKLSAPERNAVFSKVMHRWNEPENAPEFFFCLGAVWAALTEKLSE